LDGLKQNEWYLEPNPKILGHLAWSERCIPESIQGGNAGNRSALELRFCSEVVEVYHYGPERGLNCQVEGEA